MDILIQRLQELKEQQLGNLQISVPVDTMSFNKRKDEVLHDFSDLTNKSHILGSQKLRLLYLLAYDNYELLVKFAAETENKLKEMLRRKYSLYGDSFLVNHIPAHQLLKSWFIELQEINHRESKLFSSNQEFPSLDDKTAFNIKYEPFCSKCKEMIGLYESRFQMWQPQQHSLATLSFSTCRQGFCCRVFLQSHCRLCYVNSVENIFKDIKTSGSGEVKIMIDPCLGKISHSFLNKQFNDVTAKMFVTDHIWPAIDEIFNKTGN